MEILKKKIKEYIIYIMYKISNEKLYGKKYREIYNYIQKFDSICIEEKRKVQLKKIQKIVKYAYFNVPYYKELFDKNKISYKIESFEDFEKIPYLTKDIIRKNFEKLKSKENIKSVKMMTGGTTGTPMEFCLDKQVCFQEKCFIDYYWKKYNFNYRSNSRIVVLRENKPKENKKFQRIGNKLIMSSFKLTSETADEYIEKLTKFSPEYIHFFPSSLNVLAEYLLNKNLEINLKDLKGIFSSSETLYDYQKKNIEKVFKCKICDLYGHSERAVIAFNNIEDDKYKIDLLYGYTEIISEDNKNIILEENKIGEIVATSFWNKSMPLLRYKTDDLAITNGKYNYLNKIFGRKSEYLIDNHNNKITFTCSDEIFWNIKNKLDSYQYIQNEKGKVNINIKLKKSSTLDKEEIETLKIKIQTLYENIIFEIKIVDNIPRSKRGKFKYLIQNI